MLFFSRGAVPPDSESDRALVGLPDPRGEGVLGPRPRRYLIALHSQPTRLFFRGCGACVCVCGLGPWRPWRPHWAMLVPSPDLGSRSSLHQRFFSGAFAAKSSRIF